MLLRFGRFLLFRDGLTRGLSGLAKALNGLSITGGSGTFRAPKSQSSSSLTRVDVQGVQGAPKVSDSNGFDPGH